MLRAAIAFFIMGLLIFIFGYYNVANVSIDAGKLFLYIFAAFSIITFLAALVTGKSIRSHEEL